MKVKESLSSLDVAVIASELDDELRNGWLDNLYSVNNGLLLKIRSSSSELKHVIIEPGVRANLTTRIGSKGLTGRIKIFRRFLRNGRVKAVSQFKFERIMIIEALKTGREVELIIELIPRGIAALVNEEGKVLVSNRDISVKDRVVRSGTKYSYPPTYPDPRRLSLRSWLDKLRGFNSLGSGLIKGLGFPPEVVNEVIEEVLRKSKADKLDMETISLIKRKLLNFINEVLESPQPVIVFCGGNPYSFHPFIPKEIPEGCEVRKYKSMNEAVDRYFTQLKLSRKVEEGAESLRIEKTLDKALRDLEGLKERVRELTEAQRIFNLEYPIIEDVWSCVNSRVKTSGWKRVKECNILRYDPSRGSFVMVLGGKELTLKVNEDVKKQYIRLIKDLGILRRKVEKAEESVKNLQERLREAIAKEEERRKAVKLVKKVEWFHQFNHLITSGGYLAIGGRDAQQNEKLVGKYLGPEDIFLHAVIHGGSAFIVKTDGRVPEDQDLREVAVMAVSYSRGWDEGVGALDAFWVWGKQVSKSPPPGQYLPKGSFMIYGRRNLIKGVELRVSVGIKVLEGKYYEVVAGPEKMLLMDEGVVAYMTLVPGSLKPSEVSKRFIERVKGIKYDFLGLMESDIAVRVPGPSHITNVEIRD